MRQGRCTAPPLPAKVTYEGEDPVMAGRISTAPAQALALSALLLAGCTAAMAPDATVARAPGSPGDALTTRMPERKLDRSVVIAELAGRTSVLPPDSAYGRIAGSVLAAHSGTAAAELRVKRLQAQARSKNWLPSLGPSVSLSSLGALTTSLLFDQVLFDNGRRKAEREFTVADVEVAAVNLSIDSNRRVHQALSLHVDAEAARARAVVAQDALSRLRDFDRIMTARVAGGVSNLSEQTVLRQKLIEMQARLQTDRDAETLAGAELAALADTDLSGVTGLTTLPARMPDVTPLSVHLAEAERQRTLAELRMARAGYLPGLSAGTDLARGTGLGLAGRMSNGLNLGTADALKAVQAGAEAAAARVEQAGQDAGRRRQAAELKIAGLDRQEAAQREVAAQTRANLKRFEAQYKAGVRPLMDLVAQHESLAAMERDLVSMRHERARARLDIARDLGLLADGAGI